MEEVKDIPAISLQSHRNALAAVCAIHHQSWWSEQRYAGTHYSFISFSAHK